MCAGGNSVRIRQDYGLAETPGFQQVPGIAGFVFIRERAHLYTVETSRAGAHFTQSCRSLRCFPGNACPDAAGAEAGSEATCTGAWTLPVSSNGSPARNMAPSGRTVIAATSTRAVPREIGR